jgi:ankyrin repeat protein
MLYTNIHIEDNSFYITQTDRKPQNKDYAEHTLKKIEYVLKNNLSYRKDIKDEFSKLKKNDLKTLLKEKAGDIQSNFSKKVGKLNWLEKKVSSVSKKENIIKQTTKQIEYSVESAPLIPGLPTEISLMIASHLPTKDLAKLSRMNREGRSIGEELLLKKAAELGYKGNDNTEAVKYISNLYKQVRNLKGKVDPKYLVMLPSEGRFSLSKINVEETLKKLATMETSQIIKLVFRNRGNKTKELSELLSFLSKNKETLIPHHPRSLDFSMVISHAGAQVLYVKHNPDMLDIMLRHYNGVDNFVQDQERLYRANVIQQLATYKSQASYDSLQYLIDKGLDINKAYRHNWHGKPILNYLFSSEAVPRFPQLDKMDLLIKAGAKTDQLDPTGKAPIHHLARSNVKIEALKHFLKNKPNIDLLDRNGFTALSHAIDNPEAFSLLLENGANLNIRSNFGDTLFHQAVFRGNIEVLKKLLELGFDINVQRDDGITPLGLAMKEKKTNVVEFLLKNGADPDRRVGDLTIRELARNSKPYSSTHKLIQKYKPNVVA